MRMEVTAPAPSVYRGTIMPTQIPFLTDRSFQCCVFATQAAKAACRGRAIKEAPLMIHGSSFPRQRPRPHQFMIVPGATASNFSVRQKVGRGEKS